MPEPFSTFTVTTRELSGDSWQRRFEETGIRGAVLTPDLSAKPKATTTTRAGAGCFCPHHCCIADRGRGCPLCQEDDVYNVRARLLAEFPSTASAAGEARLLRAIRDIDLGADEGTDADTDTEESDNA